MAKNVLKKNLSSLLLIFLTACTTSATYSHKEVEKTIKRICKEEFNIEVNVWSTGETVWIHAPAKLINEEGKLKINQKGKWDEDIYEHLRKINQTLGRTFLSIDKPPKFYCFVSSNIEKIGADIYTVEFVPDMIKFDMGLISMKEMSERSVWFLFEAPEAIADKEGKHIQTYDISMGEFIGLLVTQMILNKFAAKDVEDNYEINALETSSTDGKLALNFNIMISEYKDGLSIPFDEAQKIVKEFIKVYSSSDISEVIINDDFNSKSKTLNFSADKSETEKSKAKTNLTTLNLMSTYYYLASHQYDKKNLGKAQELYKKVLEIMPDYIPALNNLGFLYYELSQYEKAITYLQKTLDKDSKNTLAHYGLGRIYLELTQYEKALGHLKKTLEIEPDYPDVSYFLAQAYSVLGKTEEARKELQKELAKNPNDPHSYYLIGTTHFKMGQYQMALTYYQKVLDISSKYPGVHNEIGLAQQALGNITEALDNYHQELEINPDNIDAHYYLGRLYRTLGQYQKAISYQEAALKLNSTIANIYLELGLTYDSANQRQKAVTQFKTAIKLDPKNILAYESLGWSYINMAKLNEAVSAFKKVIELSPDSPEGYDGLGSAYYHLKRYSQAQENYQKAKDLFQKQGNYEAVRKVQEKLELLPKGDVPAEDTL